MSHQLLLRAGLVQMLTAGVYSYLPLGYRVLSKIEKIITEEMDAVGANKLLLPSLHPLELWKQTGRDQVLNEVMYKFKDGRGRMMCLGPTHEEVITNLVKEHVQSYRQLPVVLYQIQTKFRDEMRPRFGIVRACEFIMKDAYSFDRNTEGLRRNYELMYEAYVRIFKRLGLEAIVLEADSGAMGGDLSHEFVVTAPIGEDTIFTCLDCQFRGKADPQTQEQRCPKCKSVKLNQQIAIELGHIFQLGTKYSDAQKCVFLDEDGKQKPIIMGCYGIGVSRVIAAIIEKHNDDKGIIWPKEVSPFNVLIVPLQAADATQEQKMLQLAAEYQKELSEAGLEVLVDDRDERPGRKFKDADLIGIPVHIIIGERNFKENNVEIKLRGADSQMTVSQREAKRKVLELVHDAH